MRAAEGRREVTRPGSQVSLGGRAGLGTGVSAVQTPPRASPFTPSQDNCSLQNPAVMHTVSSRLPSPCWAEAPV